jgi:hypothetical protein
MLNLMRKKVRMTDFTKILDKAKELESKMKESQEKIKNIQAEGTSGSNSIALFKIFVKSVILIFFIFSFNINHLGIWKFFNNIFIN